MNLYDKTEQFIVKAFGKNEHEIFYAKRTAYWIKELKAGADEALLIAGLAHDIERAIYGDWKNGSNKPLSLRKHQDMSAVEIEKFLKKEKAADDLIERVKYLIAYHEEGGDKDQNILCDADCLAYFEEKALRNAKKYKQIGKIDEMNKKLEYVFSRIKSLKAKMIAKKWYKQAQDILSR